MSETTPSTEQTPNIGHETIEDSTDDGMSFETILMWSVGAFIGIYLLVFIFGLVMALIFNEGARNWFSYFRDLLEIALSLTFITVIVGVGILAMQIARFVNLLRSEIKPITDDARAAIKNVRTTTAFVQKHSVRPIIRIQAFMAGLAAFLRELMRFSQLLQRRPSDSSDSEASDNAE